MIHTQKEKELFTKYLSEEKRILFNANILKNIRLAQPKEETQEDEALIRETGKFLKEEAVSILISDMQHSEGVPNDSESLEAFFHSHGVNMRYLGHVLAKLNELEHYKHLKLLVEKEILYRSAKHVYNKYIKDTPDSFIPAFVAHFLNCLLAPYPLLDSLNEGRIAYKESL